MKRFLASAVCVVVCLAMASAPAFASDPKCEHVFARIIGGTVLEAPNCQFGDTPWPYCLEAPMIGTLNGTYKFYFPSLDNFVAAVEPIPEHSGLAAGWGVGRYITKTGEIWTRDSWVVDLEHLDDFGFFAQVSFVVGGTGIYEGATGDIVQWGSDTEGTGYVRGKVCTSR